MIFGDSKTKKVHALILDYTELVGKAVAEYKHLIDDYLAWDKHFKQVAKEIRKTESEADDLLKEIQCTMIRGALLPAYREDYIGLLELMDRVANDAEDVAQTIRLVRPDIPDDIRPVIAQVCELTVAQWSEVPNMVRSLLEGGEGLVDAAHALGQKESEIDKLQRGATRVLFRDHEDLRLSHRMLVKQLLDQVCHVSDRIENVGDRISLIAVKHAL
jgi:predicted phosphate transport protein (TIGR00153 family)